MSVFTDYFQNLQTEDGGQTLHEIHSCPELIECIQQVGFLPLLESGIRGYSAERLMAEDADSPSFPMEVGSGRCGSGKDLSSRRAGASMASSLQARRALSAASGGPTSSTGGAAKTLFPKRERLRMPSSPR